MVALPDAKPSNWVDAYAPAALRPWLKLGRFDRPTGIWLLMLPGWQGVALAAAMQGRWPDPAMLVLVFAGAALMRAAGCAYNDIVDRDIDAKVARTAGRPIPSGQISVKQAWAFVAACSLAALGILVWLSPLAIGLGAASLVLVAAYPFMKRITWWPQAWLGLTFNWGVLLGFAAATGASAAYAAWTWATQGWFLWEPGLLTLPALVLYASGVCWTLGYDTIYAIQDLEDDALAGVKSSARRLGPRAPRAVALFYLLTLAFAYLAGLAAGLGLAFSVAMIAYAIHLGWQARQVKVDDPALALRLFKSNTWAGLILVVALVLGGLTP
ncbi:4-hydroxybenzoate octaprenyltransferase [uncultured Phenylobacterium sp.]|uniref:4-hydroxybenzoate octaprenyltransferase n=1 Tax=uncultured Phenylobacterium sp. TaxID=349273 RepID=UPI0025E1CE61|nr:4-hydroxybenzoate octaprenyltransferase [uncultured Phenylobacterium sp.]